jgi:hypothetical protein
VADDWLVAAIAIARRIEEKRGKESSNAAVGDARL